MDSSGETKIVDREMDEVDQEIEKKRIEKLAKKGIVVRTKEEKRKAKREKEKLRKMKKKGKSIEEQDENFDFENFRDDVQFGERVDAPPSIKLSKFQLRSNRKFWMFLSIYSSPGHPLPHFCNVNPVKSIVRCVSNAYFS